MSVKISEAVLEVVRDNAHAKTQERHRQLLVSIVTASEFFDQIRLLAFIQDPDIVRDDEALTFVVADVLANEDPRDLALTFHYVRLFNSIVLGQSSPQEILQRLAITPSTDSRYPKIFSRLALIAQRMEKLGKVDKATALARALDVLRRQKKIPNSLKKFKAIYFKGLVDLSELELTVVLTLAELGMPIRMEWPIDEKGRGVTLPVSYLAERVEQRYDLEQMEIAFAPIDGDARLAPFVRAIFSENPCQEAMGARVHVCLANDISREARWVAQAIAALRCGKAQAPSIAIALRTLDERTAFFKDALLLQGISCRERRGQTLRTSPCAQLILEFFYAKAQGFPKERLIAILSNAAFKNEGVNWQMASDIERHFKRLGVYSDVEDLAPSKGAYVRGLEHLLRITVSDDGKKSIRDSIDVVYRLLDVGEKIPDQGTLYEYQSVVVWFLEQNMNKDVLGWSILHDHFTQMAQVISRSGYKTTILGFARWLEKWLAQIMLPAPVCHDADAVELLALPELLFRRFDYVVIVDMVHGRLPKNADPDPLLKDSDRFAINHLMGRQVLRLYEDSPVEKSTVPPRQALEPMWFLGACGAAREGLIFTASCQDEKGREQAKSEFFDAVLIALGQDAEKFEGACTSLDLRLDQRESRFWAAKDDVASQALSVVDQKRVALFRQIKTQRALFFAKANLVSPMERADTFAFKIDRALFRRRFAKKLGLEKSAPLTPTRLESLAHCRFRGFVERMLNVDTEAPAGQDMDARTLGRLAHEVLEGFYKNSDHQKTTDIEKSDRIRLSSILAHRASHYLELEPRLHRAVLQAYIIWLDAALQRLVSNLAKNPPVEGVSPFAFELPLGLEDGVPLQLGNEVLYVGGILDRVDEGPHARVVIDYKTSTLANLKRKVDEDEVLRTHFQLPLYLRLLEHHKPTSSSVDLLGYLVSIRDGTTSAVLGRDKIKDLRRRVLDDEAPDGLVVSLKQVLQPLFDGVVPPDLGERCDDCRLRRVCRVPLSAQNMARAPEDLSSVDES